MVRAARHAGAARTITLELSDTAMPQPLIALISAVPTSIPPTTAAFGEAFPDARLWNILDDRLLVDADEQGGLTPQLAERMKRLIEHAKTEGADAILLTCSLYAPVAHDMAVDADIPLLAPDDAVFAAATTSGFDRIALVSSGAAPLADSVRRLSALSPSHLQIVGVLAEDAAPAARSQDTAGIVESIATALAEVDGPVDAVVLGQFSLAPSADALAERVGVPVLAGPQYAVELIHERTGKELS